MTLTKLRGQMFDLIYRYDPTNTESRRTPQRWKETCDHLVRGNRDFAEMNSLVGISQ